jgi:hypothetical protein
MEPKRPFDPLRPIEPLPSPFRPASQHPTARDEQLLKLLKDILDRISSVENRLKSIEDTLRKHNP